MKAHLIHFLEECTYTPEDTALLLNTYDKIMETPETAMLWQQALSLYEENIDCDYSKILELTDSVAERLPGVHAYTTNLLIYLCMTKHAAEVYRQRGLDEALFKNTMLDLRYKLEECKLVKGVCGSFVVSWFARFFNLTRFAFGRLQFEITDFDRHYEKDGKVLTPHSKVINIHIPRTQTPLTPESCDDAFRQAAAFFKDTLGSRCVFMCHSWLLFPEHEHILSPKSNTYRFMKRFDIFESGVYRDISELWRLFDTQEQNPDRLPADSGMRKAYLAHLKNGGKTGWGTGVFFYD